ncbi:DedA family protein [Peribacillus sp. NPDC096379]|uniref:DedA family protein n=1 Tax=Peribacillus sp. NPDC096379 TaxID=3364393 RepID=UPI0037F55F9E
MSNLIMNILLFFQEMGYLGIALGLMIEIIPSELVLGFGGYLIGTGVINFWGALLAGVIGGTFAQLFLYWAGYFGGRPFLLKYGKYIFIKETHIDAAEQWFEKYGVGVVFTARFIPIVRHAISIPAGIAKMSFVKFTAYTIAAMIPWTILFLLLGNMLGENWSQIKHIAQPILLPIIIVAIIGVIIYTLWKRKQEPPIIIVSKRK